jgi:hypothetical protein
MLRNLLLQLTLNDEKERFSQPRGIFPFKIFIFTQIFLHYLSGGKCKRVGVPVKQTKSLLLVTKN